MTCIAMGLTGVASMIRVFGDERIQYWREASGLPQPWCDCMTIVYALNTLHADLLYRHTIAYFFGKDLSMIPQILMAPLVYCVIYLNITTPRYRHHVHVCDISRLNASLSRVVFAQSTVRDLLLGTCRLQ